ncbi:MAG: family 43 glycosylhydrolase [bacterium]|nr:family 43 glycosylhydrolase [bacterium]
MLCTLAPLVTAWLSYGASADELPGAMTFTYSEAHGLGPEKGVCRRDPSDVIRVDGTSYVWYTKVVQADPLFPSGYNGTVWYATSDDQGHTWTERGMAVGLSDEGFDSFGVFTPNILPAGGRYYLYYTAVAKGFVNTGYAEIGKTAIGVAVADSPDGPWTKPPDNVMLRPNPDHARFDSYRVDDACLIVRDGAYWLYYKGRQWEHTPRQTKMGVAVATDPLGRFVKQNDGRFIQDSGHEVLVWPYGAGVMSLVSNTGPNGCTLQYAEDGIQFRVIARDLKDMPAAPGAFREDLSDNPTYAWHIPGGISMVHAKPPYLRRFECRTAPPPE